MGDHVLVTIETIDEVNPHPKADRLELLKIGGWVCVGQLGLYKPGDKIVYFAVDSVLPNAIEGRIFSPDSKVKLKKARVQCVKIRGCYSMGLPTPIDLWPELKGKKVGTDVTDKLKVTKHEQKVKSDSIMHTGKKDKGGALENPNFAKVRKPERIERYPEAMNNREIIITEKIHGTSSKCGYVKRPTKGLKNSLMRKLKGDYEFCYRSMNRQLQRSEGLFASIKSALGFKWHGFYKTDVYEKMTFKYNMMDRIPMGYQLAYEIYGSGIQTGYAYGLVDEQRIAVYGVLKDGVNLSGTEAQDFCEERNFPYVPVLFSGEFSLEEVQKHTVGRSVLDPGTKVREGCVVETYNGSDLWMGKCLLKSINPKYEEKDQSEFH